MQIFSPEQIREWDQYTISHEPVSSLNLMERAASRCVEWLEANQLLKRPYTIFCGKGNNGGDGLAIARLLTGKEVKVTCYILEQGYKGSDEFQANLARLHSTMAEIIYVQSEVHLHPIEKDDIVIDAIFGSGLNRPPGSLVEKLISHINRSGNPVIAIDIPSGMFAGRTSGDCQVIRADFTLTFQCYKLAFLMPENEQYLGKVILLDIGLHPAYLEHANSPLEMIDIDFMKAIYQPRKAFSHKGTYGHSLLIGGSFGKMGAIVLACRACLRTGTGLLSSFIPGCGIEIMQTAVPEAMVRSSLNNQFIDQPLQGLEAYKAIGIGPGLGTDDKTATALEHILKGNERPMVIDADALNLLAAHPAYIKNIPLFSILTPHPKEFERLFGKSSNDFERLMLAREKAKELQLVIILKGHYTLIAMPGGKAFFNSTGNPGMAKGGSGDVLTGMLTGLLAQGYQPSEAALMGVYLHGLAGDHAARKKSEEAMIASDIIESLPDAFFELAVDS